MGNPERAPDVGTITATEKAPNTELFEAAPSAAPLRRSLPAFFILSLFGGITLSPLAGIIPVLLAVALFYFHRNLRENPRPCGSISDKGTKLGDNDAIDWTDIERISVHNFIHEGRELSLAKITFGRFKSGELRRAWDSDRPMPLAWRGMRLIDPETLVVNLMAFHDRGTVFVNALMERPNLMVSFENKAPEVVPMKRDTAQA